MPENWGGVKGGKGRISKITDLNSYLSHVRSFIPIRKKTKLNIHNELLNRLVSKGVDLKAVLAICILTDGCLTKDGNSIRIIFYSKDKILADFAFALLNKLSSFNPSIFLSAKDTFAVRVSDNNLGKELLQMSPDYRTYPPEGGSQPTIKFLENANEQTKKWCIRFAFTTDGCISFNRNKKAELNLACYNKSTSEEWQSLLSEFGIESHLSKSDKSRQGCVGLRIYKYGPIKKFQEMGGFIDGVKISKKSKKYCGMEKNELLKTALKETEKRMGMGGFEPPTARLSVVCATTALHSQN